VEHYDFTGSLNTVLGWSLETSFFSKKIRRTHSTRVLLPGSQYSFGMMFNGFLRATPEFDPSLGVGPLTPSTVHVSQFQAIPLYLVPLTEPRIGFQQELSPNRWTKIAKGESSVEFQGDSSVTFCSAYQRPISFQFQAIDPPFETDHPYLSRHRYIRSFSHPGATKMRAVFGGDKWETWANDDWITIRTSDEGQKCFGYSGTFEFPGGTGLTDTIDGPTMIVEMVTTNEDPIGNPNPFGFVMIGYEWSNDEIPVDPPLDSSQFSSKPDINAGMLLYLPYDQPSMVSFEFQFESNQDSQEEEIIYWVDEMKWRIPACAILTDTASDENPPQKRIRTGRFSTNVHGKIFPGQRFQIGIALDRLRTGDEENAIQPKLQISQFQVQPYLPPAVDQTVIGFSGAFTPTQWETIQTGENDISKVEFQLSPSKQILDFSQEFAPLNWTVFVSVDPPTSTDFVEFSEDGTSLIIAASPFPDDALVNGVTITNPFSLETSDPVEISFDVLFQLETEDGPIFFESNESIMLPQNESFSLQLERQFLSVPTRATVTNFRAKVFETDASGVIFQSMDSKSPDQINAGLSIVNPFPCPVWFEFDFQYEYQREEGNANIFGSGKNQFVYRTVNQTPTQETFNQRILNEIVEQTGNHVSLVMSVGQRFSFGIDMEYNPFLFLGQLTTVQITNPTFLIISSP
jgi:hypothetical protein